MMANKIQNEILSLSRKCDKLAIISRHFAKWLGITDKENVE